MARKNGSTQRRKAAPQRSKRHREMEAAIPVNIDPTGRVKAFSVLTNNGTCCGKVAYDDQPAAERALQKAQANRRRLGQSLVEKRVYECRHRKWHLTHLTYEDFVALRERKLNGTY